MPVSDPLVEACPLALPTFFLTVGYDTLIISFSWAEHLDLCQLTKEKMQIDIINALRTSELFSTLNSEYLEDLKKIVRLRVFGAGEILFERGKKADGFYLITDGEVEIFCSADNGREQILHNFTTGDLCGEVPLFEGSAYPASARARGDLITLYVPGSEFLDIAYDHPQILLEMLAVLSRRLKKFVQLVENLSLKDVSQRVLHYLKDLADDQGRAALDCSKIELAARIGTVPETVSRSLKKLHKQGFITAKKDNCFTLALELDESSL